MKTRRLFLYLVSMLCLLSAQAFDFEYEGIYYDLCEQDKVEVVANPYGKYAGEIVIPDWIPVPEGDGYYNVAGIADQAFYVCEDLQSIQLPWSLERIGLMAFAGCSSLQYIDVPGSVETIGQLAFYDCASLQGATIQDGVKELGSEAFLDCSNLRSIYFSNDLTEIKSSTCRNCENLNSIKWPDNLTFIDSYAFYNCTNCLYDIELPQNLATIGAYAFAECTRLENIRLQKNVEEISDHAFYDCIYLQTVTSLAATPPACGSDVFVNVDQETRLLVPLESADAYRTTYPWSEFADIIFIAQVDGMYYRRYGQDAVELVPNPNGSRYEGDIVIPAEVTINGETYPVVRIGERAFVYCVGLTSVSIPFGIKEIGNYAFQSCYDLTDISLPESLEKIEDEAFAHCNRLNNLILPNSLKIIGNNAFFECFSFTEIIIPDSVTVIYGALFQQCENLTRVHLPEGMETIPYAMFYYCPRLEEVNIPSAVRYIESHAFKGCSSLTHINLPAGIEYIYPYAFEDCTGFTEIALPANLTYLGTEAFKNCTSLQTVASFAKTPPRLEENVFENIADNPVLSVPYMSVDAYANDEMWSATFASIQPMIFENNGIYFVPISEDEVEVIGNPFGDKYEGSISIPDGFEADGRWYRVTRIADQAFKDCENLTHIYTNWELLSIGDYAFANCTSLSEAHISDNVRTIGQGAFEGCTVLIGIYLPDRVVDLGAYAFRNCESLLWANLSNNISEIKDETFRGCTNLNQAIFPEHLTKIGYMAFYQCKENLYEIKLPESLTTIGAYAFAECKWLQWITLRGSVMEIQDYAFSNCPNLYTINSLAIAPPTCGVGVFDGSSLNAHLNVPFEGLEDYKSCYPWSEFANIHAIAEVDDIYYRTLNETSVEIIANPDGVTHYAGDISIPEGVDIGGKYYKVVKIGWYAFFYCEDLTNISLPEGLTTIDFEAFHYCKNLRRLALPYGLKKIGDSAFGHCENLIQVDIPETVVEIDNWAFTECTSLINVALPENLEQLNSGVFYGCTSLANVILPPSLIDIHGYAFYNCSFLQSIALPETLEMIGDYAFSGCTSLTEIDMPKSVNRIGVEAFKGCTGFTEVILPKRLNWLGGAAFSDCSNLTSVICLASPAPDTDAPVFENIGDNAIMYVPQFGIDRYQLDNNIAPYFRMIEPLKIEYNGLYYNIMSETQVEVVEPTYGTYQGDIYVPSQIVGYGDAYDVERIGCYAFASNGAEGPSSVTISDGIKEIWDGAFAYCQNLTTVYLSDRLVYIGPHAFQECTSLAAIELPESLETIAQSAFVGCTALQEITIPSHIVTIAGYAFGDCASLTRVNSLSVYPPYAANDAFANIGEGAKLYVPLDGLEAYKNTEPWSYFYSIVPTIENIGAPTIVYDGRYVAIESFEGAIIRYTTNGSEPTVDSNLYEGAFDVDGLATIRAAVIFDADTRSEMSEYTTPAYYNGEVAYVGEPDCLYVAFGWCNAQEVTSLRIEGAFGPADWQFLKDMAQLRSLDIVMLAVTEIPTSAFQGSALESIELPNDLNSISDRAFSECSALVSVANMPTTMQYLGVSAFFGCGSLEYIAIPSGLTAIPDEVFFGCRSLTEVTVPEGVYEIDASAFNSCTKLTSVTLPETLASIETGAFQWCSSLTTISLPKALQTIGYGAFQWCGKLAEVKSHAVNPPVCQNDVFKGIAKNPVLWVPESSLEIYKSTNPWSTFFEFRTMPDGGGIGDVTIDGTKAYVEDGVLYIASASYQTVVVYNAAGVVAATIGLVPGENHIPALRTGVYIINNQKILVP